MSDGTDVPIVSGLMKTITKEEQAKTTVIQEEDGLATRYYEESDPCFTK